VLKKRGEKKNFTSVRFDCRDTFVHMASVLFVSLIARLM
jgi:hypothetical protein